jgi:NADH-quinone oxidoreductase subunit E
MLSEEERQEIEEMMSHYQDGRAACIEALKVVQRRRRWVSDQSLEDLAQVLGMSRDELDDVATFYNLIFRKPVGEHVILVCNSVSCWIRGYDRIRERLSSRLNAQLGETSADGKFTLLPMVCLGACDHAPVMMVDEDTFTDLTIEKVDQILDGYA